MPNQTEPKTGKRELLLVGGILLLAGAFFLWNQLSRSRAEQALDSPTARVIVSLDGKQVQALALNTDTELTIESPSGGTNHLVISHGEAWISEASCPDKICVHQGKISHEGEIIVCLPNLMTVQISNSSDGASS